MWWQCPLPSDPVRADPEGCHLQECCVVVGTFPVCRGCSRVSFCREQLWGSPGLWVEARPSLPAARGQQFLRKPSGDGSELLLPLPKAPIFPGHRCSHWCGEAWRGTRSQCSHCWAFRVGWGSQAACRSLQGSCFLKDVVFPALLLALST